MDLDPKLALAISQTLPKAAPRYKTSKCQYCGGPYQPKRWDQHHCSKQCKNGTTNLEMVRGRQLYSVAMRWRLDRKNSARYLKALCRIIARFAEEDSKAGRPQLPHLYPDQVAMMDGWRPQ